MIGFGPGDESQAHAPNEINRIDDLEKASAFYAALPYALEKRAPAADGRREWSYRCPSCGAEYPD